MSPSISSEPKYIYRLSPCPSYDLEATESWLSYMASQGFLLSEEGFIAGIATFEKTDPCFMRYRLAAITRKSNIWSDNHNGEPTEKTIELNKARGWHYVTSRNSFSIYSCSSCDNGEFNTDLQVQAASIHLVYDCAKASVIYTIFWLIIYPLIIIHGNLLLTSLNIKSWLMLWLILLLLWHLSSSLHKVFHLRFLKQKLASGLSLNHTKDWQLPRRTYRFKQALLAGLTTCWICLFLSNLSTAGNTTQPLENYTGDLPFATIADFAPYTNYHLNTTIIPNTIEINSDCLSPTIIKLHESATITLKDNQTLSGNLSINYYETLHPLLASELIREYLVEAKEDHHYTAYQRYYFDTDYYMIAYNDVFPTVLIQKGSKVILASFYTYDTSIQLSYEQWGKVLADSLN